jgi:hypothetical protein
VNLVLAQSGADPDVVRRTTEQVLSQADYTQGEGPSLIDRLLGAILEQLGIFLLRFSGGGGGDRSTVAAVVLVGIILALVVAIVVFLRRLRRSATVDPVVEGQLGRTHRAWGEEALARERDGDLRGALRCRYRQSIARLAQAGLVDEIPGRTTGEYLRAVGRALPEARSPFALMTTRFEEVWYGGQDVSDGDLRTFEDHQRQVDAAVPSRLRVGAGA